MKERYNTFQYLMIGILSRAKTDVEPRINATFNSGVFISIYVKNKTII